MIIIPTWCLMQGKNQQRSKNIIEALSVLEWFLDQFFQAAVFFWGKNHQQRNFLHEYLVTFKMPKGTVKMKIQLEECQKPTSLRAFQYTSWFFEGFRYLLHNTSEKRMLTKRWYSIKRKIQPTPFLRSIEGASAISANHQHHSLRSDIFYLNDNYGASLDSKQKMGNKSPRNGQSAGKLKTQHKMCLTQCKTNVRQLWMWTQTNNKRSLYTKIHHNTS